MLRCHTSQPKSNTFFVPFFFVIVFHRLAKWTNSHTNTNSMHRCLADLNESHGFWVNRFSYRNTLAFTLNLLYPSVAAGLAWLGSAYSLHSLCIYLAKSVLWSNPYSDQISSDSRNTKGSPTPNALAFTESAESIRNYSSWQSFNPFIMQCIVFASHLRRTKKSAQ